MIWVKTLIFSAFPFEQLPRDSIIILEIRLFIFRREQSMKRSISNFESNILIKCIHQNVLCTWDLTHIVGGRQMQSFFKVQKPWKSGLKLCDFDWEKIGTTHPSKLVFLWGWSTTFEVYVEQKIKSFGLKLKILKNIQCPVKKWNFPEFLNSAICCNDDVSSVRLN